MIIITIALVSLASQLSEYDFVGHFHTEDFGNEGKLVNEATRFTLTNLLLDEEKVASIFASFPEVGLIFADLSKNSIGQMQLVLKSRTDS